jgi:hypothetical protein
MDQRRGVTTIGACESPKIDERQPTVSMECDDLMIADDGLCRIAIPYQPFVTRQSSFDRPVQSRQDRRWNAANAVVPGGAASGAAWKSRIPTEGCGRSSIAAQSSSAGHAAMQALRLTPIKLVPQSPATINGRAKAWLRVETLAATSSANTSPRIVRAPGVDLAWRSYPNTAMATAMSARTPAIPRMTAAALIVAMDSVGMGSTGAGRVWSARVGCVSV